MELGKFKGIDFDEENHYPEWLQDHKKTEKPAGTGAVLPLSENPSRVKSDRSRAVLKPSAQTSPRPPAAVSIQINLPHFRLPRPSVPWRVLRLWLVVGTGLAVLLVGGKLLQTSLSKTTSTTNPVPIVPAAELGYKPLSPPSGFSEGAANIPKPTYDEQRHFYAFNDIYKGANVTVTQQAVPEKLKASQTETKKAAANIGATESFTTTLGSVYVGTSKESGTQRLMLINDKMLMFIQSTAVLSNADWVAYVQSLQ